MADSEVSLSGCRQLQARKSLFISRGVERHETIRPQPGMRSDHEIREQPFRSGTRLPSPLRVAPEGERRFPPDAFIEIEVQKHRGVMEKIVDKLRPSLRMGQKLGINRSTYDQTSGRPRFTQHRCNRRS